MKRLILIILSFQLIFFPAILNAGDIIPDAAAPEKNRPQMDKAPNEVPVVNIVSPSAKGVSHNKFTEYNVNTEGLILNNSIEVGQSELGGMLYGNPNFQHNKIAADIVLNEVTGVTQTSLLGYTEMFGKSAEFVLANPNGIIVSGGGFINTPRVTLSTGTPQIDQFGDLQGLDVENGMILINESTLNTTNMDYFEIISRTAKIEAEIRAGKNLGIKTGRNYYDYKNKTVTPKTDNGGEKPIVAIDSVLLGGMYAGRIYLIATEDGVGVNSENGIGANIEDVTITANGDVVLKKDIAAKRDINIKAKEDITLEGISYGEGSLNLEAGEDIELGGNLVSGVMGINLEAKNLNITAAQVLAGIYGADIYTANIKADILENLNNDGSITAGGYINLNSGQNFDNSGYIASIQNFNLNAQNAFANTGTLQTYADFNLNANTFYNTNKISGKGEFILNAAQFENSGDITSENDISVDIAGDIKNNNNGVIKGENIILGASNNLQNLQNAGYIGSKQNFEINLKNNLNNIGTIETAGNLELIGKNATFDNLGRFAADKELILNIADIENSASIVAGTDLKIDAQDITNNNNAEIAAAGNLILGYDNPFLNLTNLGTINSKLNLNINLSDQITNSGKISALSNLKIADGLTFINNASGEITAGKELGIGASDNPFTNFTNAGSIGSTQNLNLYGANILKNTGSIKTAADLYIAGKTLNNYSGEIIADGEFTNNWITSVNNQQGKIVSGVETIFDSLLDFKNSSGSVLSDGIIDISLNTNFDIIGNYYAGEKLSIAAPKLTNNTNLDMQGAIFLNANTGSFTNNAGKKISSATAVNIDSKGILDNYAEINSEKDITINTGSHLYNQSSATITGGAGNTIVTSLGNLYNYNEIGSAGNLNINTAEIQNQGQIASGADIAIETDTLQNKEGAVIYAGSSISINATDYIENIKGNLLAAGSITIQKAENQNNNRVTNYVGLIEAGGDITINTNKLENKGEDSGSYYTTLVHKGSYQWNSYGLMDEYVVTPTLDTNPAYITSGRNLNINGGDIDNYGSAITAAGDVNIIGGTLKNETAAISVTLSHWKKLGMIWNTEEKGWCGFSLCSETTAHRDSYWISGTIDIRSKNSALIQSGKAMNVNVENIGNEAVNESAGNKAISGQQVTVSYNDAGIKKIKETGTINILDFADLTESALFGFNNDEININSDNIANLNQDTPKHTYLIETRVKYINIDDFYGSDYFLEKIGYIPDRDTKIKIIGDAYYETQAIKKAIFEATAQRFLNDNIPSDIEQMKYLLDNAVKANQNMQLAVGVELTPEQIKALEGDIIWYVEEEINGQKVLVPRLYLASLTLEALENGGSVIKSGGDMILAAEEEITNTGSIQSGANLVMDAKDIINKTIGDGKQAEIKGVGVTYLKAENNIVNTGGYIEGGELLALKTETGDIINETEVFTESHGGDIRIKTGAQAGLVSKGDMLIDSGNDFINKAAQVKADGNAQIEADNDITFETVKLRNKTNYTYGDGYAVSDTTKNVGSSLDIGGSLGMESGNDITIIGSEVNVGEDASIKAERNFNMLAATDTSYYESVETDEGFLSSETTTTVQGSTKNVASNLNIGGNLQIVTDGDIGILGSNINADGDIHLQADKNINVVSGADTYSHSESVTKKEAFSSSASQTVNRNVSQVKSNISSGKNITTISGGNTNIIASDIAADNQVAIIAGKYIDDDGILQINEDAQVNILSAMDSAYSYEFKQEESLDAGAVAVGVAAAVAVTAATGGTGWAIAGAAGGGAYTAYGMKEARKGTIDVKEKYDETAIGSTISGNKVSIQAANDVSLISSDIKGNNAEIFAGKLRESGVDANGLIIADLAGEIETVNEDSDILIGTAKEEHFSYEKHETIRPDYVRVAVGSAISAAGSAAGDEIGGFIGSKLGGATGDFIGKETGIWSEYEPADIPDYVMHEKIKEMMNSEDVIIKTENTAVTP